MPTIEPARDLDSSDLEQTAILLAQGFEQLLSHVQCLAHQERQLKAKLDDAHDQVRLKLLTPTQLSAPITLHRYHDEKSKLALDQELPR
jgi:hypothetical protein